MRVCPCNLLIRFTRHEKHIFRHSALYNFLPASFVCGSVFCFSPAIFAISLSWQFPDRVSNAIASLQSVTQLTVALILFLFLVETRGESVRKNSKSVKAQGKFDKFHSFSLKHTSLDCFTLFRDLLAYGLFALLPNMQ